ncbi:MAG TPA: hypothetical protein VMT88_07745, partial [Actinomycetes bacterium]|nr:hypothetical protein [Actinomycetes bacterium]
TPTLLPTDMTLGREGTHAQFSIDGERQPFTRCVFTLLKKGCSSTAADESVSKGLRPVGLLMLAATRTTTTSAARLGTIQRRRHIRTLVTQPPRVFTGGRAVLWFLLR